MYAADEIGVALTWTRRAAEAGFDLAWELSCHPGIAAALSDGRIDLAKAKTIVFGLNGIDTEVASQVADQIMERAERQTTGQIRARLAKLVITADPAAAADRYQAGLKDRKVVLDSNQDGTANLHLYHLPVDQAALAFDRLDQHARLLGTGDEPRTLDQLRADVAADLLVGCQQHLQRGRKPIVDLRVDLTTLMELNENPGEIPGFGPVIADIARQLAEQQKSEWRFTVIDGHDILMTGTTRRRPSRPQRRRIQTRYPHCVFPGCRTPAIHADLDHRQRWADGGLTEDFNLNPLCPHNHGSKDRGGWHLEMVDRYTFKWTSPLGLIRGAERTATAVTSIIVSGTITKSRPNSSQGIAIRVPSTTPKGAAYRYASVLARAFIMRIPSGIANAPATTIRCRASCRSRWCRRHWHR